MLRLSALIVSIGVVAISHATPAFKTGAFDPPRAAPDFALRGSNGAELKLSKYRGKVVALGFGYTSCPDVCPTTLAYLADARKKLGASAQDFQVIYVTVDPDRDNVALLRKYLEVFDPTFLGGTGTTAQLAEARKDFGITATREQIKGSTNYYVHHSAFVYLIDRAGKIRVVMPYGVSPDDMVHDVKLLLNEGGK